MNGKAVISISCAAPTKVYKLCLSKASRPQELKNAPICMGKSEWRFETLGDFFRGEQTSARYHFVQSAMLSRTTAKAEEHLVCSTVLDTGLHTLDASEAIFFFDSSRFLQQRQLITSGAKRCEKMQRDGFCSEGDCCKYSHVMPEYFNPEVHVYVGCMHEHCRQLLCTSLRRPVPLTNPFFRGRVYVHQSRHHHLLCVT